MENVVIRKMRWLQVLKVSAFVVEGGLSSTVEGHAVERLRRVVFSYLVSGRQLKDGLEVR